MNAESIRHWRLYVITDEALSGHSHPEVARAAIAGGADVIQLRDKTATSRKLFRTGRELARLGRETGVPFLVNDRVDIALATDADGVHLGQEDLPVPVARELLGAEKMIGCSAATLEEAVEAERAGADYLGVGPIFEARTTKPDAGVPVGLELLTEIRHRVRLPLIAIGGITRRNARAVIRAGADGVAVISDIVAAPDIRRAAAEMQRLLKEGKT